MTTATGYIKKYDYDKIRGFIKVYYECSACHRRWYPEDNNIGFLLCVYCHKYTNVTSKIDTTSGNMGLKKFNGELYSTNA